MLSAEEARVVGSMVEKAMTTPDHYPMSLNGVVTACNQVSNRDPVVSYDEGQVELILRSLADRGLAKMVHRPGDRVVKYRHGLDAALEIGDKELALIAVLLLRGAQTPGELRQRTQRYVDFASLPEVEAVLEDLRNREEPLLTRLDRRPGQKEHRYRHLLTPDAGGVEPADQRPAPVAEEEMVAPARPGEDDELAALRSEVARLTGRVDRIARELGID